MVTAITKTSKTKLEERYLYTQKTLGWDISYTLRDWYGNYIYSSNDIKLIQKHLDFERNSKVINVSKQKLE